eukprot:gene421-27574_t
MADSFYDVMPVQQQAVAATAATAAAEPAAAAAGGGAAAGTLVAPQIDMTAINGTLHATQFFKSLESRVDKFALPQDQLDTKRKKIRESCQMLINGTQNVAQFLAQMQFELQAPIPLNMHEKLASSLQQFKELKIHTQNLQTQMKAARAGGTVDMAAVNSYSTTTQQAEMQVRLERAQREKLRIQREAQQQALKMQQYHLQHGKLPPARSGSAPRQYGLSVANSWEIEAMRLVVGNHQRPHTLYPLPPDKVMKAPMLLNAPVLNQVVQQNVAAVMPIKDEPKYDPAKKDRVAEGVHQAISDGVQAWLSGVIKQVSTLCKHRLTAEQQFPSEETSLPKKQIEIQNLVEKHTALREAREREARIEMRKRKGGLSDAEKQEIDKKKQAEAAEASKKKDDDHARGFFKKKRANNATFVLPPMMRREDRWKKGATAIIYIKKEPGTEGARAAGKVPRKVLKTRISTEDLVCFLENTPMLAKSKRSFVFFASRGSKT